MEGIFDGEILFQVEGSTFKRIPFRITKEAMQPFVEAEGVDLRIEWEKGQPADVTVYQKEKA